MPGALATHRYTPLSSCSTAVNSIKFLVELTVWKTPSINFSNRITGSGKLSARQDNITFSPGTASRSLGSDVMAGLRNRVTLSLSKPASLTTTHVYCPASIPTVDEMLSVDPSWTTRTLEVRFWRNSLAMKSFPARFSRSMFGLIHLNVLLGPPSVIQLKEASISR